MQLADPCICSKHMLELHNEGTCLWCGHGPAVAVPEMAYARIMRAAAFPAPAPEPPGRRLASVTPLWSEDDCIGAARRWQQQHGRMPTATDWQQPKHPGEERPSYGVVRKVFGGWRAFMRSIADIPRDEAVAA